MADHGGARKGAGRPKLDNPKKTVVVRVDESLLPIIKKLKDGKLDILQTNTKAQADYIKELEAEIVALKAVRTDRDARSEVARLQSIVDEFKRLHPIDFDLFQ